VRDLPQHSEGDEAIESCLDRNTSNSSITVQEDPVSKEDLAKAILSALQADREESPPVARAPMIRGALIDRILYVIVAFALTSGGYYAQKAASTVEALLVLPDKVDQMTSRMDALEQALTENTSTMKLVRDYTVPEPPAPAESAGEGT